MKDMYYYGLLSNVVGRGGKSMEGSLEFGFFCEFAMSMRQGHILFIPIWVHRGQRMTAKGRASWRCFKADARGGEECKQGPMAMPRSFVYSHD